MDEPKGIAFTGKYLVTADQNKVLKIDRKGKVSVLVDKKNFTRNVSFLNDVATSSDRKSIFVTDMGAVSMMFDPDKDRTLWPLNSKQAKELTAEVVFIRLRSTERLPMQLLRETAHSGAKWCRASWEERVAFM